MLTGMDIGGTNTDIAFIRDDILTMKVPNSRDILDPLTNVRISGRLGVSTSWPLNLYLTGEAKRVLVITIPGPGLAPGGTPVAGAVDHRGEVVEPLDPEQIHKVISESGPHSLGICGKFAVRNPALEWEVSAIARSYLDQDRIALSHPIGILSFPARTAAVRVNARIKEAVVGISRHLEGHFSQVLFFLGDGGLAPACIVQENPALLLHSSAAAVALGARYLTGTSDSLVIDIGGTTTDIIPLTLGKPVKKSLVIDGTDTLIPSVTVTSLPVGGDSQIHDNRLVSRRLGNARAFGGPVPTLTDALNGSGCRIGDFHSSAVPAGTSPARVIDSYVRQVTRAIRGMETEHIIGTGFLAEFLIPKIAAAAKKTWEVPDNASCANAIGVAVSRISMVLCIHADSGKGRLTVNGIPGPYSGLSDEDLIAWGFSEVRQRARRAGAPEDDVENVDLVSFRSYDVIREGRRREHITDLTVQITPGITGEAL